MPLVITDADFHAWETPSVLRLPPFVKRAHGSATRSAGLNQTCYYKSGSKSNCSGSSRLVRGAADIRTRFADKEMLMAVAGQLAFVIENSRLVERMVAEERLRRELALAADVQQRLFPSDPPSSQSVEMAGYCQPL